MTEGEPLRPAPKPGLMGIAPYVGGRSSAQGANRVIKLSSNENPHGPSPAAIEAFRKAGERLACYPDGGAVALREAIAEAEGLDPARIVCGAGSDEIIALLCQAYAGPGDEVLYSRYGFLMYAISAMAAGATPVTAPETDLRADVDALLEAANERTKLVFLANPNNPTGATLPDAEIRRLREGLPGQALLVLDAAYAEYVDRPDYDAGAALVSEREDVVMTRTFSKIHGLAALRLGWCYAPEAVVDALNRVRGPFNASAPALAAGEAAIRDTARLDFARDDNTRERARVEAALAALDFVSQPSEGNFLLVHFGVDGPHPAANADEFLQGRGILVRRMEGYGLPAYLRITIGTEADNAVLIAALTDFARKAEA